MLRKSPSHKRKMAASGIWSLEGTPGILEVHELPSLNNNNNNNDDLFNTSSALEEDVFIGAEQISIKHSNNNDGGDEVEDYELTLLNKAAAASEILANLEEFNYHTEEGESDQFSELFSETLPPILYENINTSTPSPVLQQPYIYNSNTNNNNQQKYGYESSPVPPSLTNINENQQYYSQSPLVQVTQPTSPPVWSTFDALTSQLTPPSSPSMYDVKSAAIVKDLPKNDIYSQQTNIAEQQQQEDGGVVDPSSIKQENMMMIMSMLDDELNQKQIIDELIRSHDMVADESLDNNNYACSGYLSPENSSLSSSGSETMSEYHSDYSSDPDYSPYSPELLPTRKNTKNNNLNSKIIRTNKSSSEQRKTERKPYARKNNGVIEDKKMRKKEQNKNAATRYRLKKKQEIEVILGEEKELQDKHESLQKQVDELLREIKFTKNFMREFFKNKGKL